MLTEDRIKALKKELRRGIPAGEIREQLLREGCSPDDIARVFVPHQYDMRSWYLVSGIIVGLLGLWTLFNNGSFLFLILSGLLFVQYYREAQRLQSSETNDKSQ